MHLRRADLRIFVGCGAAAAIAAAFNAPLAGAFYAFELIIGSYTLATLVPVVVAAVMATVVTRDLFGQQPIFIVYDHVDLVARHYLILAAIGVAAAGLAIAAMLGVTFVEQAARRMALPVWARPAVGGLLLGAFAVPFPEVLGSGHGGIVHVIATGLDRLGAVDADRADRRQDGRLRGVDRQRLPRRHVQLVIVPGRPVRRRLLSDHPPRRAVGAA